jgi:3-hydroxyacyl-CoA dehydrogenase
VVLLAFSVPKLYELKKDEIDSGLQKVSEEIKALYEKHLAKWVDKIPRAKAAAPTEDLAAKAQGIKEAVFAEADAKKESFFSLDDDSKKGL